MVNVNTVKILAEEVLVDKDHSGQMSSDDFNYTILSVNQRHYNESYGIFRDFQPARPVAQQAHDMTRPNLEKMRYFLTHNKPLVVDEFGQIFYPANYTHLDSLGYPYFVSPRDCNKIIGCTRIQDLEGKTPLLYEVKWIPNSGVNFRLTSQLLKPRLTDPDTLICSLYDSHIQVYPMNMKVCLLTYYRTPQAPVWGYTMSPSGRPIYNSATSTDFDFPETELNEIVNKVVDVYLVHLGDYQALSVSKQSGGQG